MLGLRRARDKAPSKPGPALPDGNGRGADQQHVLALDGVRGLAILLVLLHNLEIDAPAPGLAARVFKVLSTAGWIGVVLFFALSGYLITSILLRSRTAPRYFRNFFLHRLLRIFPLYYATLAIVLLAVPHLVRLPRWLAPELDHQLWFWTYLSNWTIPFGRGIGGLDHLWSLAVEEQFYLVWPLVVRALAPRRLAQLALVLGAGALLFRTLVRATGSLDAMVNYYWTTARIDALAFGALIAVAGTDQGIRARLARWRDPLLVTTLVAVALLTLATRGFPRHHPVVDTFGYSLVGVWAALVVARAAQIGAGGGGGSAEPAAPDWMVRGLRHPALRWWGRYSYGIYVFHGILHHVISGWLPAWWLQPTSTGGYLVTAIAYLTAVGGLSAGLAFVSYHLFEKRFLALKSRFPAGSPGRSARSSV